MWKELHQPLCMLFWHQICSEIWTRQIRLKDLTFLSHRKCKGDKLSITYPPLAGSDRCVKTICFLSISPSLIGLQLKQRGRSKRQPAGESKHGEEALLFPLSNQRDIAGGKLWEISLPKDPQASCRDRWLTEKPQLRDLWCSLSVHISVTQSTAWTQFLHHPTDYCQ